MQLVPKEIFEKLLAQSMKLAESKMKNAYHCKTNDCTGWCIFEDDVNIFKCPVCSKRNCLTCRVFRINYNLCISFLWVLLIIKYSTGMLYAIVLYVRPSVCLSVRFHDNSWTSWRRIMKLCKIIVEVKSDIEFKDGLRTWPLTRSI